MAAPQQPPPPTLVNDNARRPDSLTVTWPTVADAQSFNARITDEGGSSTTQRNVSRPFSFDGLIPTKKYMIAIQSQITNVNGTQEVSTFSDDLTTRTRPETPGAPLIIQDAVTPVFLVKWQITGPISGIAVLRRVGGDLDQIVATNLPLTGEQAFSSLTWRFLSMLIVPQDDMPNGVNESFWSPSSQLTTVEAVSSNPSLLRTYGVVPGFRRGR
jgi:hypothetical protein